MTERSKEVLMAALARRGTDRRTGSRVVREPDRRSGSRAMPALTVLVRVDKL